jgi:4-hydroxybenzoate polyprenyltransferase
MMTKLLRNTLRLLRPRQWMKNFAIFAAIIFSGQLFSVDALLKVFYGFLIFCALSSAIYVINDLFDMEKDRLHPFKRFRPLANKDLSPSLAIGIATVLILISIIWSYFITPAFFIITLIYFVLQFSYTIFLKHIEIVDILVLAGGYILRVYAGEVISSFHISAWLLLTTISLALFLAIGKRRSELTLLGQQTQAQIASTRKTLSHYSEKLLDVYLSIFATSTFISYTLFTFLENPQGEPISNDALMSFLSVNLQKKWLMLTIIPVVYGLMRYRQRIYEKHEGESPERVLFSDRPLLTAVVIWAVLVVVIVYFTKG